MARVRRLKVVGESAYYHIISRTVGQEYYLGEKEKEKLLEIIRLYSDVYFVKVIGFCIMDNHFHLLIKMENGSDYSDEELIKRLKKIYKLNDIVYDSFIDEFRRKLGDLSEYVKEIKQRFSRWYNKVKGRSGYFWGDRFKSVLVEGGEALKNMLMYIDLNPVRAGIVERPELYRWSSAGYRYHMGGNWLSFDGVYEDSCNKVIMSYISLLHNVVGLDDQESKDSFLRRRLKYFVDGLVIGSKEFIKEVYEKFEGKIITKKDRRAHNIGIGEDLYSIRCVKS